MKVHPLVFCPLLLGKIWVILSLCWLPRLCFLLTEEPNHPLGILPQFPVTLGGKIVFIDVMVVQDPLDFDLLLGRDYVYTIKSIVSTLFHVIYFPHNGIMVTIDQLSFVSPDVTINPMTSLNGSNMQSISPLP
jgi:hypothetical protein